MAKKPNDECPEGYTKTPQIQGLNYTTNMPQNGGFWCYGPNGQRVEGGGNSAISGLKLN